MAVELPFYPIFKIPDNEPDAVPELWNVTYEQIDADLNYLLGKLEEVLNDFEALKQDYDTHSHSWSEITGKPSTFPPSSHTHSYSSITGTPAPTPSAFTTIWTGSSSTYTFAASGTYNVYIEYRWDEINNAAVAADRYANYSGLQSSAIKTIIDTQSVNAGQTISLPTARKTYYFTHNTTGASDDFNYYASAFTKIVKVNE